MAHTLSITDYLGTTTSLASTGSTAGYKLQSYSAVDATPEIYYNASMYTSGARPVWSRSNNIVETIIVDIYGSSRNDALNRLRYLQRALWWARDTIENPNLRTFTYLSFLPDSSSNTSYSIVLGGTVTPPQNWLGSDDAPIVDNKILGVTLTIEREPYWRGNPPVRSTTQTDHSTLIFSGEALNWDWGVVLTSNLLGDLPGLPYFYLNATAAGAPPYFVSIGYASELRAGSVYDNAGVVEAEGSGAFYNGATSPADANASSGYRVTCPVTTSTLPFFSQTIGLFGNYRVYARAMMTGGATGTLRLDWANEAGALQSNAEVTTSASTYSWVNLGVVQAPGNPFGLRSVHTAAQMTHQLSARRGATAGDLYVDFLFYMPLEYNWTNYNTSGVSGNYTVYDAEIPWHTFGGDAAFPGNREYRYTPTKSQGLWRLPPGNGAFYFISGSADYSALLSNTKSGTLYYVPLFSSARGNDS